jgi:hypothetical protein
VDFTYPGTPFAGFSLGYYSAGTPREYTSDLFLEEFTTLSEQNQSFGSTNRVAWILSTPELQLKRTISFGDNDKYAIITNIVLNQTLAPLTNVRWYEFVDVDMDQVLGTSLTVNDVRSLLAAPPSRDWVESVGPISGWTMGFAAPSGVFGHDPIFSVNAYTSLVDYNNASNDSVMGLQMTLPDIPPGWSAVSTLMVAFGATAANALATYTSNSQLVPAPYFLIPGDFDLDQDVDGYDFLKWQRGESPTPFSATDLADWEAYYGAPPLSAASTAVPEPATGLALLIAMMTLAGATRVRSN